jgi:hypothetical protein
MDWQGALRARLTGAPAITALVGTAPARVYWVDRPQASALPAITLQVIDEPREQHMGGFHSLQAVTVQVDAWATSYASARAVKEAVIDTLVPEQTGNGIAFQRAFVRTRDLGERVETQFIHRSSMDFVFHYSLAP